MPPNDRTLDTAQLLDLATAHHKAGHAAEAAQAYARLLEAEPGNATALHLFGGICRLGGRRRPCA